MDQEIVRLRAALGGAAVSIVPEVTWHLGALLTASARDEEAQAALGDARLRAMRAKDPVAVGALEIAFAAAAVARDEDALAEAHLATARHVAGETTWVGRLTCTDWLVRARIARARGVTLPRGPDLASAPHDDPVLVAELALEEVMSAAGARPAAQAFVETSRSPRANALLELELALFAVRAGDGEEGRRRAHAAASTLAGLGLVRDHGRALLRIAEVSRGVPEASVPAILGRAQTVLGARATWRDRLALFSGFQSFGRRVFDKALADGAAARIESFERARGALLSELATRRSDAERGLDALVVELGDARGAAELRRQEREAHASEDAAIAVVDRTVRDLVDLIGAALVERDRLRVLLSTLADLDAADDTQSLPPLAARAAARVLDADYVVIGMDRGTGLVAAGRYGEPAPGAHDGWKTAAENLPSRAHRARSDPAQIAPRAEEPRHGPVLVAAFRAGGDAGVLYADRVQRGGQFRDQDQAFAYLLAEYISLALGKLRAIEEEQLTHHQLAVTLDAIRDGVIACDAAGTVTHMNVAAARMLRVQHEELRGARLDAMETLAPLWHTLAPTERGPIDGAVVRLTHGSLVVTSRPIGEGEGRGFVATLVELDRAQKMAQRLTATRARYGFNDIVGASPPLQAALDMARRAATIDATVLITGESGTGKEVIAQAIHTAGPRAGGPFVGINCAALPRELLEAELFGYEKGAFTGARAEGNPGKFELAADGTILLDEIGDMPLDMQAKLLRVLQERTVTRLGGRTEIPTRVRVIATTHCDLEQLVDEGRFRMDLLFRLRVLPIALPPLRERPEDIRELALFHLRRFAEQQRKRLRDFDPHVQAELERYDWPGNVRELANVMEAEVSLAAPDAVTLERLATRLVGRFRLPGATSTGEWRAMTPSQAPQAEPILPLAEVEKRAFLHALERMGGNVAKAAEALGVSKVTFYAKLRSWGMHPRERSDDDPTQSARWSVSEPPSSRNIPIDPPSRRFPAVPPSRKGGD